MEVVQHMILKLKGEALVINQSNLECYHMDSM